VKDIGFGSGGTEPIFKESRGDLFSGSREFMDEKAISGSFGERIDTIALAKGDMCIREAFWEREEREPCLARSVREKHWLSKETHRTGKFYIKGHRSTAPPPEGRPGAFSHHPYSKRRPSPNRIIKVIIAQIDEGINVDAV